MSKTGTKKLTLPDEVDGVKLSWSQEKSNTAAKIAMLEVVVIVLLVLEKKEKKEDGAEGEKYTTAARISGDS